MNDRQKRQLQTVRLDLRALQARLEVIEKVLGTLVDDLKLQLSTDSLSARSVSSADRHN